MTSKEPKEPKPISSSLNILQLIKTAQQKHGLRHENYQRYRGYCARRVERIRKSLKFTHHYKCLPKRPGKFIARTVTPELVGDKRYLELIVFEIERCWAHAMEFKFEALDDPLSRKKFGMRQKFRKAAKWAQFLGGLVKDNELVQEITNLESQAYISFVQGSLELELRKWKEAAEQFNASRCREVENLLKLCRSESGDANVLISTISSMQLNASENEQMDIDNEKPALPLMTKKKQKFEGKPIPVAPFFIDLARNHLDNKPSKKPSDATKWMECRRV
uniref:Signal recognition particle subunit SRP68 n=1 Tax=Meloidogyne hapla TaxID=6305 RepID=A0A1I8B2H8_MELHA